MSDLGSDLEISKYLRVISSSEIDIDREDIFYRDKYNDIINYLKIMLTNHADSIIQKYVRPKGRLIINISPGTDIIDYLKLISKNYYLRFVELNYEEILKSPADFYNNFNSIISRIIRSKDKIDKSDTRDKMSTEVEESYAKESKITQLILINQNESFTELFEGRNLLKLFVNSQQSHTYINDILDFKTVLIWINNDLHTIKEDSGDIFQIFDLFIKIPLLNKNERETILRDFSEKNSEIVFDINTIVEYTANWEVRDIIQLLKLGIFKHFLNSELNQTSNEITDILMNLIESGEFIPSIISIKEKKRNLIQNDDENRTELKPTIIEDENDKRRFVEHMVSQIQKEGISDFMLTQLYENAASKNYTELLIIIDKLSKDETLEGNERKILAKYPFILNDSPHRAQINLEKAKKRVDNIKQAFGSS